MFQCSTGSRSFVAPTHGHTKAALPQLDGWPSLDMNFGGRLRTFCGTPSTSCVYGRAVRISGFFTLFHGKHVAILGHALTKEDKVPKGDIDKAIRRKRAFEANPTAHSYVEEDKR